MITGTIKPADGAELMLAVQEIPDGEVKVILYVGGRMAARLDNREQQEFLDLFRAAQSDAARVRSELRRTHEH